MALDNNPAAVDTYNRNLAPSGKNVATCVDIAEFRFPGEILAYYLLSFSDVHDDGVLRATLADLGLREFIEDLALLDESFRGKADAIITAKSFKAAYTAVSASEKSCTLFREFLTRFRFPSPGRYPAATPPMLWDRNTPHLGAMPRRPAAIPVQGKPTRQESARRGAQVRKMRRSILRDIDTMAKAFPRLGCFLRSKEFEVFATNQLSWISHRIAVIQRFFCNPALERKLRSLYDESRRVHVIAGGPPCQGFSRWGRAAIGHLRRVGLYSYSDDNFGDQRNRLFRNYVAFLAALAPDIFLFENVSTFNSAVLVDGRDVLRAGEALEAAVTELSKGGLRYCTASTLLNASRLGVPQNRERFVMIGVRGRQTGPNPAKVMLERLPVLPPVPLSEALIGLEDNVAYLDALVDSGATVRTRDSQRADRSNRGMTAFSSWIRFRPNGQLTVDIDAHIVRRPSADDEHFFAILEPGTTWQDIPLDKLRKVLRAINPKHHFLKGGYLAKRDGRHGDWLARMHPDRPSRAVCAHLAKDGYAYVHPTEPRTISVREAARIQSFPDWFSFAGRSLISGYSLVGNAVPPLLAAHLARSIVLVLAPKLTPCNPKAEGRPARARAGEMAHPGPPRQEALSPCAATV